MKAGYECLEDVVSTVKNNDTFGKDPLACSHCGGVMELWKIWHPLHGFIYDLIGSG